MKQATQGHRVLRRTREEAHSTVFLVVSAVFVQLGIFLVSPLLGEDSIRLRVLSYNIHHGEGLDGNLDLNRIARVISSAKPDLVALQEVDSGVQRSGLVDQPARLAQFTRMHVVFGGNIELERGKYGNAILSRFPILSHQNSPLPLLDSGEQRGVLHAEIELPGNQSLAFFATHFDHRKDRHARFQSAQAINSLVKLNPDRLAIIAGDLNDTPESETLRILEEQWTIHRGENLLTIPATVPNRQIDFVLVRPAARWRLIETMVLTESVASDHRPILSVLELLVPPMEPTASFPDRQPE